MMSKHRHLYDRKHISDLSDRQFRRRIKSETEKALKYVFENIKSNDDDDDTDGRNKKRFNFYNIIILKSYLFY